ncbi:hypothetical protein J4211_03400 [Candidatus Woesearchaeota archaeon]|nr:hypothetical protein [Candidatus Woesearchaeota archaeon]
MEQWNSTNANMFLRGIPCARKSALFEMFLLISDIGKYWSRSEPTGEFSVIKVYYKIRSFPPVY